MQENDLRVCPASRSKLLDNSLRKLMHNPKKILKDYISAGMIVLDYGCGSGYFTTEMAKLVGENGTVIAADLQQKMLDKLKIKIRGKEYESIIQLHKCEADSLALAEKVDFILAFYMLHEVPSQNNLLKEMHSVLKPEGKFLIVEPVFHVTKEGFEETMKNSKNLGFDIIAEPKIFFSRSVLLKLK